MNKDKVRVKDMMENMDELSQDLFLSEQNIRNMVGKLAKEMYKKHENGTQSVQMWVVENKDKGLLLPRKWCLG
jgi:predicted transcriptional regulator